MHVVVLPRLTPGLEKTIPTMTVRNRHPLEISSRVHIPLKWHDGGTPLPVLSAWFRHTLHAAESGLVVSLGLCGPWRASLKHPLASFLGTF